VCRSKSPVGLARLTSWPFADRGVAKFDISVNGWRGKSRRQSDSASTSEQA